MPGKRWNYEAFGPLSASAQKGRSMILELMRTGEIADYDRLQEILMGHLIAVVDDNKEGDYSATTRALIQVAGAAYNDWCNAREQKVVWLEKGDVEKAMMDSFSVCFQHVMRHKIDKSVINDHWWCPEEVYQPMPLRLAQAIGRTLGVHAAKQAKSMAAYFKQEKTKAQ